jgi:hypothetical protein
MHSLGFLASSLLMSERQLSATYTHTHTQAEKARRDAAERAAADQSAARLYRAARSIQDAWRARRNRSIFEVYKDLLGFRWALTYTRYA